MGESLIESPTLVESFAKPVSPGIYPGGKPLTSGEKATENLIYLSLVWPRIII